MASEPIAIVGMGAVFPGAADLGAYWANIAGGVDAITDVPASRWDAEYFDPAASGAADRFYCKRGGFVEARFDPVAFGLMPRAAAGAEPDQLLALHVAAAALADAAYGAGGRAVPSERTGVVLGRGGYLTPGMARLANRVRTAQQLATTLAELLPDLDAATVAKIRAAFAARAGDLGAEAAIGLVPNLAASRIANRLDLRGPAYTVDAACASSLLAVDQACNELAQRRCDLMIAGGVHVCHDVTFWSVFTQLGALSHAQQIRPFDRRADGILIGEGAGVVVLKRLADAERDGDRVYAVVRGAGISSDGRESSAMRPRADGQLAALDRAWRAAECDPREIGLVEAHGTATVAGDEVELTALGQFFGEASGARAVVGSVKSMIGHAMPAAGAAGLVKAALAVHHGVLPPSLHCNEPHVALQQTRFRIAQTAEPWGDLPRRAGVSAFGFGGINAHVVIEAHGGARRTARGSSAGRRGVVESGGASSGAAALASGTSNGAAARGDVHAAHAAHDAAYAARAARGEAHAGFDAAHDAAHAAHAARGEAHAGFDAAHAARGGAHAGHDAVHAGHAAHGAAHTEHAAGGAARALVDAFPPVLRLSADSLDELRARLDDPDAPPTTRGAMRLAIFDPTPERRAMARKVLDRGKPWRGNHDIWFAPTGLAAEGATVALLFPGIEVGFAPLVDDLAAALGQALPAPIEAARAAGCATARELELRGAGVFELGKLLARAVARLGVAPAALAGHSMGEWTAMVASEMIPPAVAEAFVADLRAGSLEVPDVVFAAAGCSAAGARAALDGLDAIAVSHDNCPHQSIVCGRRDRVATAVARLGARGVLCQELPFRSGFHSPLFADFLAPHRRHLAELALQAPRVPVWSATTAAPYPADPDAIRALAIAHLVEPVRFRELVEQLHAGGVRAFVQLGVGSLVGFAGDTLRGKEHLAIAAASEKHGGLAQLARVHAALWVEGFVDSGDSRDSGESKELQGTPAALAATKSVAMSASAFALDFGAPLVRLGDSVPKLSLGGAPRVDAGSDPILAELLATLDEAAAASRAVVDAYRARGQGAAPAHPTVTASAVPPHPTVTASAPPPITTRRPLSVSTDPHLLDHCFYRQPPGWPTASDRYPVVPMTMTISLMLSAARARAPGRVAIALEDVRAYRWLAVAPPVEAELTTSRRDADPDRIDVDVPGYARATVVFADAYPPAPRPALPSLTNPRATPIDAAQMYADRWMFHGPAYQGVTTLGPMGDDGVDGAIDTLPAEGALLDCAGQLMGWWVMQTAARDRLAMPVRIERIALFGPHPAAGERVPCRVRMRHVGEREVRADLELGGEGGLWAQITGWEDRRFDSDDAVWSVLMYPEHHALAASDSDGYALATEHWTGAASRELMMRRYLGERERAEHERLGPRARRGWLLGRIAIKDAVRLHLWGGSPERERRAIWPIEIEVANEASGRPTVAIHEGVHARHTDENSGLLAPYPATTPADPDPDRARGATLAHGAPLAHGAQLTHDAPLAYDARLAHAAPLAHGAQAAHGAKVAHDAQLAHRAQLARPLHVSVAHKDDVAVAIVSEHTPPGIDIERIEPRTPGFLEIAFTPDEVALGAGRDPDEWYARLWAAKEAVAKARGTGITDPRALAVRAVDGERLYIDEHAIETRRRGAHAIAWTPPARHS